MVYKKVYQIAKNCDFYLINQASLSLDEKNAILIDHILFGDKFIYLISGLCRFGTFAGTEEDDSWFFYTQKGGKVVADNPINDSKYIVEKFSLITGIEDSLIKSMVVVNDDCYIEHITLSSDNDVIVSLRGLYRLVRKFEKSDIPSIEGEQLEKAVRDIHALTKKKT